MEALAGSRVLLTPVSARLGGQASIVTSRVFLVRLLLNSKVQQCASTALDFVLSICHKTFSHVAATFDILLRCRCGSEPAVQEFRAVFRCWKHTLLPLPGWLHWELLPRTGRWVLTQPLSEWSNLYRLPWRLQLWGKGHHFYLIQEESVSYLQPCRQNKM